MSLGCHPIVSVVYDSPRIFVVLWCMNMSRSEKPEPRDFVICGISGTEFVRHSKWQWRSPHTTLSMMMRCTFAFIFLSSGCDNNFSRLWESGKVVSFEYFKLFFSLQKIGFYVRLIFVIQDLNMSLIYSIFFFSLICGDIICH